MGISQKLFLCPTPPFPTETAIASPIFSNFYHLFIQKFPDIHQLCLSKEVLVQVK
ncbi:MAG: hypothetical protein V7K43_17780 [Nostoc sp.]